MEYKIFKKKQSNYIDFNFVDKITNQFNLSFLSALVLHKKGLNNLLKVEEFLYPKEESLYSPYLFNDIDKILNRLKDVIFEKEKIIVFSDYDADGVMSSVILYKTLKYMHADVEVIIPNRFTNGYGLNNETLDLILKKNPGIVITADNGITSVDEIEILKNNNIDVIITDHHTPPKILPDAFAILNPKVNGEIYPFSELAGAGVVFKLVEAIIDYFELKIDKNELIVLAMIATIADIVPLIDENRTITYLGLKNIKHTKNKGLKELIRISSLNINSINSGNIAFQIAPRINAAGRLKHAYDAFLLFTSQDEEEIKQLALEISNLNDLRKSIEDEIYNDIEKQIKENSLLKNSQFLFIHNEEFNEGVMGIACGKIAEKYNRPVVVLSGSEILKASARSIHGIDLYLALNEASDLFEKFGGHKMACGFSIKKENLEKLIEIVNNYSKENNLESYFYKRISYDLEIIKSNINISTIKEIDSFAPFGLKNSKPLFLFEKVYISNARKIGSDLKHLKFNIMNNGLYYDCIGFNLGYLKDLYPLDSNETFDIIFSLSINDYMEKEKVQFEIKDIVKNNINLNQYYLSLYNNFKLNKESILLDKNDTRNIENLIDTYNNEVLIVYSKDIFIRLVRYLEYKKSDYNISYNKLKYKNNAINILVNPTHNFSENNIVVIDEPKYHDFEREIYEGKNYKYLGYKRVVNDLKFSREFFVYLYKKFKLLDITNSNVYDFIKNIENESDINVNIFSVLLGLDILKEMDILEYKLTNDNLSLSFKKINHKKDINKSSIMIKLTSKNN